MVFDFLKSKREPRIIHKPDTEQIEEEKIIELNRQIFVSEFKRLNIPNPNLIKISKRNIAFRKILKLDYAAASFTPGFKFKEEDFVKRPEEEIEILKGQSFTFKIKSIIHESIHALTNVLENTGLETKSGNRTGFIGLNEGITEHYARFLFLSNQDKFGDHNFLKDYLKIVERHDYSPLVDLWEEWFRKIAIEARRANESEIQAYERVRDNFYRLYLTKNFEGINKLLEKYISPETGIVYESVRPKQNVSNEQHDHIHRYAARKSLIDAKKKIKAYEENRRGFLNKEVRISRPHLDNDLFNAAELKSHYEKLLSDIFGFDFLKEFPLHSFSAEDKEKMDRLIEYLSEDIKILRTKNQMTSTLEELRDNLWAILWLTGTNEFKTFSEFLRLLPTLKYSKKEEIFQKLVQLIRVMSKMIEKEIDNTITGRYIYNLLLLILNRVNRS
jgi:hypothetical protein